jgi:hypothetical protein
MNELQKIDKLLKLYEHNPNQNEARAALKKAASLMRLYINRIRSEQISSVDSKNDEEDKICKGCGEEKPKHKEGCQTALIERRLGWAALFSCLSCGGLVFVWFVSACIGLFNQLFG